MKVSFLKNELRRSSAYLLPLRLFIGIGWIRAGLEKLIVPAWPQGTALPQFFNQQLSGGHVVFPFYQRLITQVFTPNAMFMSWLIMIGQILVGLAVMFGAITNLALLFGLFMNFNFVLAGQVNPSAFYIVIQVVLLVANVGVVFGLDRVISRRIHNNVVVAQPFTRLKYWRFQKALFSLSALFFAITGFASVPYIRDYSPHSVDDPAMLLLVLSVVIGLTAFIMIFQKPAGAQVYRLQNESYSSQFEKAGAME